MPFMEVGVSMSKSVAIVTDTNSGIFPEQGKELGVTVIRMPFFLDGQAYYENEDLNAKEFYERMNQNPDMEFSTSMPPIGEILSIWSDLLENYDEIVYIPMSSGLSSSCQTAMQIAQEMNGKVQVVDNQRISATQEQSIRDAIILKEQGKGAKEIKAILEAEKFNSSIYITVDSLDYLKKGGRITASAALLGGLLKIKPVLQIQGEKLDTFAKARGMKAAKKDMIKALKKDLETRFKDFDEKKEMQLLLAYTYQDPEQIEAWLNEVQEAFPGYEIHHQQLSLSISCHLGPGGLGIGCAHIIK